MSVVANSGKPFTSSIIPNKNITSNIITLELVEHYTLRLQPPFRGCNAQETSICHGITKYM
jgi:hypothetical protein